MGESEALGFHMNTSFEAMLKQLGLSDKEAKVYLAGLVLGPSPVVKISEKSGINRPTTYVQIESLMKLGLMSSYMKGKKQYFAVEPPERLQELTRIKEQEVKEQSERLREILPELRVIFDTAEEQPKVRFFEGKEGIMAMAADIFKTKGKEILTITSDDLVSKTFSQEEREKFEQLRARRKIRTRALYTRKEGPFSAPPPSTVTDQFIPYNKFPITAGIDIYDNKLAAYTLKGKLVGAIIESQEIANTLRSIFELAWENADKYQEKK